MLNQGSSEPQRVSGHDGEAITRSGGRLQIQPMVHHYQAVGDRHIVRGPKDQTRCKEQWWTVFSRTEANNWIWWGPFTQEDLGHLYHTP